MAKQPAKNANISINAVALEDDIDNFTLPITQELPVVTCFGDAGPRRVTGNYDYGLDISGGADFAAAQSDATLFGLLGNAGVAMAVDPTGASAGANDPNYDATSVVLESYQISGAVGGRVDFSAALKGNSALARAVA
jgi:hypothetical protein